MNGVVLVTCAIVILAVASVQQRVKRQRAQPQHTPLGPGGAGGVGTRRGQACAQAVRTRQALVSIITAQFFLPIFLSPSNKQMRQMPHLLIITSYGSQVPPTETVIPPFDEGL